MNRTRKCNSKLKVFYRLLKDRQFLESSINAESMELQSMGPYARTCRFIILVVAYGMCSFDAERVEWSCTVYLNTKYPENTGGKQFQRERNINVATDNGFKSEIVK